MHERDGFSAKTLGKSLFHFQTDWSGKGPAGQFWQMESAQSKDNLTMARADLSTSKLSTGGRAQSFPQALAS